MPMPTELVLLCLEHVAHGPGGLLTAHRCWQSCSDPKGTRRFRIRWSTLGVLRTTALAIFVTACAAPRRLFARPPARCQCCIRWYGEAASQSVDGGNDRGDDPRCRTPLKYFRVIFDFAAWASSELTVADNDTTCQPRTDPPK